jgi:hypothetical protein
VKREFEHWAKMNPELKAKVPAYIAAAVVDQASWLTARRMWLYECGKRAQVAAREQERLEAESRRRVTATVAAEHALEVAKVKEAERRQRTTAKRVEDAGRKPGYSKNGKKLGRPMKANMAELRRATADDGASSGGTDAGVEQNESSCLNTEEGGTSPG